MMMWFDRPSSSEDETVVADYMSRLASVQSSASARLPGADVLWVKAQLLRRWDAERKAQAPLDLMEPVQVAVGLAAVAVLLVWSLPSLQQALALLRG
jgi:hypothetical protein